MTDELRFEEEVSFRFKGECNLDTLVSAFCSYYEEANYGQLWSISEADLVSGKLTVVRVTRGMVFGGEGDGLLLFYSEDGDTGAAVAYIYTTNPNSVFASRPTNKIREQFNTFFAEKCAELVEVQSRTRPETPKEAEAQGVAEERQPQGWLTPIRFCKECDAVIAIDESTYCWNCGAKLQREAGFTATYGEETVASRPQCDEVEYDRHCMVCKLDFKGGQLLAWCPHCGAPAHRIHMLEWLHVKGTCPACGQHLATPELEEQLSQVHFQLPSRTQPRASATKTTKAQKH